MKKNEIFFHWLYGMLIALLFCMGKTVCENHDLGGITAAPVRFVLALAVGGAVTGAVLMLIYRGLAVIRKLGVWSVLDRFLGWCYAYPCMWLSLTAVYFLCYLAYYPGTFAYDMPAQTWQAYGRTDYNTYQPVLHTLLWAVCVRVGERLGRQSLALVFYSVFQLVCVTSLVTYVIYNVQKMTRNGYAVVITFLYYLLNPTLHLMAFSTTKDVFFACFFTLFFLSLYEEMQLQKGGRAIKMVVFGLLACLFRNNMSYVVVVLLVAALFMRSPKRIRLGLLAVVCLYSAVVKAVFPLAGVKEGPDSEALPVMISQLSGIYVMYPEYLDEDEKETILAYMPNAQAFNPRFADYVKSSFNDALLEEEDGRLFRTWLHVLKKAPVECLNIFLDLNVDYWYPDAPFPDPYSQRRYIETDTQETLDFFSVQSENRLPAVRAFYDAVAAHEHWSMRLPLIRYFYALAFPCMSLLLCIYLAVRGRNGQCVLSLLTLVLLFLTYLLGPVSIFRYLYPYYLSLPLYFSMAAKKKTTRCAKDEVYSMKKIVFIIPNMTGGGTERVISLLSGEYIKRGYQVAIMQFAGYRHAYELDERVEDFAIAGQSKGNPLIWGRRIWDMRRYFKKNPDCHIFAFCVMGAVFSVIATVGMKRRLLVAERNSPDSCNVKKLRNWAYRRADVITFQTEDGIGYFPQDIAKKAVIIPNPIDAGLPAPFAGERAKKIVTAGRLHSQKNQTLLLEAFADFRERRADYKLHIYGEGELEENLKCLAGELGIEDDVVWHGFSKRVKEEIVDSRMFVLSSDFEGISNSMLEALAMGIPTISTDCPIGGARVYIEQGVSGLLVPVGDRGALTEAMLRVAEDDALAERLSAGGVKLREKYSPGSIAERFLEAAGIHV